VHARYKLCICAHVCAVVHSALGYKGGGGEIVYDSTCCLVWVINYDRRKDSCVVCVFSIFDAGGSVCECRCVYPHTHTHTLHIRGTRM